MNNWKRMKVSSLYIRGDMMENQKATHNPEPENPHRIQDMLKFLIFSVVGLFTFFVPININGTNTVPLDHMVTYVTDTFSAFVPYYILAVILLGAVVPFVDRSWNKSVVNLVLSILKVIGLIIALMLIFDFGPSLIHQENMGPYLYENLVTSVGVLLPIGAIFLVLIVGYGLLEFIGVFLQSVMRPVWKTPGRSAVDAVASFVGSYALGLLITNRVFKQGQYSKKEASIIATGFSTVSVTFMLVIAKELDIMHIWNTYFWVSLVITFLVTAITVRIWPLSHMSDEYYDYVEKPEPEHVIKKDRFKNAWSQAMDKVENTPSFLKNIWINLVDGILMAGATLPSILSVGLLGLILAEYTPTFDILGYIFYPFTWLVQVPEPLIAAKAVSMEIAEMFLPSLLISGMGVSIVTKFVIAVVSVSAIIFFSATIPVIMSTEIPIKIRTLVIIWVERTILTVVIVTPLAYLLL